MRQTLQLGRWGTFNFQLERPTVDGFGPMGRHAHQPKEHIIVDQLPIRMALFAEVVASFASEVKSPKSKV